MHLWEEVSSTFCYSDILIGVSGLYTILIFDVEKYLDLLPIYYSYQFFFFFSPTTIGIHLPHIHGMVFSTTLIFFYLVFFSSRFYPPVKAIGLGLCVHV